jgi:hypothetical protein
VSKIERTRDCKWGILFGMGKHSQGSNNEHLKILSAEKDGEDGVLIKFSDGTITGYVPEELLRLRPVRESVVPRLTSLNGK